MRVDVRLLLWGTVSRTRELDLGAKLWHNYDTTHNRTESGSE